DQAKEKGIEIAEKPLPVAELVEADEVFLTNAIRRIKWVRNIGDTSFEGRETRRFSAIIF
ncbi:MAG TPA: aminotransferase class IV, partial [Flavipsychrobacter sp.]|nr:aminotransferase class IV [Flavipsychrobacter sp.]